MKYIREKRKLGDGRAGKVYECVEKTSRRTYAVKYIVSVEARRQGQHKSRLPL